MNEINDTNISLWVEKFLDGETSCAEERELYRYFAQKRLPAEAEPYREMFKWYSSLLAGEAAESLDGTAHESDTKGNSKVLHQGNPAPGAGNPTQGTERGVAPGQPGKNIH